MHIATPQATASPDGLGKTPSICLSAFYLLSYLHLETRIVWASIPPDFPVVILATTPRPARGETRVPRKGICPSFRVFSPREARSPAVHSAVRSSARERQLILLS
jgi:hypothetical protein